MSLILMLFFAAATPVAPVLPPVADTLWTDTRSSVDRTGQQTPGSERYARLDYLLERTIFKVDVIRLTIVVDRQTAAAVASIVSGNRRTDELEDAVAARYMETLHADIALEFQMSIGYGHFIGGIRETSELLAGLDLIDAASAERIDRDMDIRFSFLREEGIREGDRLSYTVRGDSVQTSYVDVDGNTLLDDVVVGQEWRMWTLGSYFARKTNFHDGLLDLIFGG